MIKKLLLLAALLPISAQAETFASSVITLNRGTVAGDFAGLYGGDLSTFPVALTTLQATAAVLGSPDNSFLSLPGQPGVPGTGFAGAYVELGFGGNFDANNILNIWEVGDNQESAQLFLWTSNGGNIQTTFTRGSNDKFSLNLTSYAGILSTMGGSFTKVGIGGLDRQGVSQGFDLDAASIAAVPEPETYAMLLAGLGLVGFTARRKKVA